MNLSYIKSGLITIRKVAQIKISDTVGIMWYCILPIYLLKKSSNKKCNDFQNNNNMSLNMKTLNNLTFAQKMILKKVSEKTHDSFQDWVEYEESYNTDYNDCHGDYFDAE